MPTREDLAAAAPAQVLWLGAVRRLPERLPNGRDYNVIAEAAAGRYVVQETTGYDRLGTVRLFEPGTGRLDPLLDVDKIGPDGKAFSIGYIGSAKMAGPDHVALPIERRVIWYASVTGTAPARKVTLPEGSGNPRAYWWWNGHPMWSDESDGIWRGDPPQMVPDSAGFFLSGDSSWATRSSTDTGSTRVERWNPTTGARFTVSANASDWRALSCTTAWCLGVSSGSSESSFVVAGVDGTTGSVPTELRSWNTLNETGLCCSRFVEDDDQSEATRLLWDTHTGKVASLPNKPNPTFGVGNGPSMIALFSDREEKVVINLNAIT